jgi:transcriptional regulator with XRE-family HTH domain
MGHLAGVVRSLREDASLTQEELAAETGLSVRTISDIERGLRRRLYRDTAERLGAALGLAGEALAEFVDLGRGRTEDLRRDLDAEFRRRFVGWYVDRVAALADHIGREEEWYAVLDADRANLTVALGWAADAGDAESLLRLGAGLFRYWQARGDLAFGRGWLQRGLDVEPQAGAPTRMNALWGLAWLAHQQGDDACTATCADLLGHLARAEGSGSALRNAATLHGIVALASEDVGAALEQFGIALGIARGLEQPWLLATSLLNLGIAQIADGDLDAARSTLGDALREYDELGDERFRARTVGYFGLVALVEEDPARAEALYLQSLTVFEELDEGKGIAEALTGLATAAAQRGSAARAAVLGGAAERVRESFAGRALPVERRRADQALALARATVDAEAWRAEWTRGRALRLDEAITEALDVREA